MLTDILRYFQPVLSRSDLFVEGVRMTLLVALCSIGVAVVLGVLIALAQLSPLAPLRGAAVAYVQVMRGIPLYVYIIWLYFGLALGTGISLAPISAGVIALSTLYAAKLAEVDRGAIQAIPRQQREAAAALGLTPWETFRYVIGPQALRIVIPPTTTYFATMIMDSSLVSVIGVTELMRLIRQGASDTFRPFEFYTAGAIIYSSLVFAVTRMAAFLERRVQF